MLNPLPEYIKVRSYLYNFAMKNRGECIKIPSENELAAMFGVSRVTVRGALKALLSDRLLFSRRGMGTFVNPEFPSSLKFQAAGMLVGSGECAADQFSPTVFSACQICGIHPEILFVPDSGRTERMVEQCRYLDAVIWQTTNTFPLDYWKALREAGIPLLTLSYPREQDEFDNITISPEAVGDVLQDCMKQYGHSKVLFVTADNSLDVHFQPGSTYYQCLKGLRGAPENSRTIDRSGICQIKDLPRLAARSDFRKKFSLIYCSSVVIPAVTGILSDCGIRIPEDLSCVVYGESSPVFFGGRRPAFIDYNKSLKELSTRWLFSQLLQRNAPDTFREAVAFEFIPGDTVTRYCGSCESEPGPLAKGTKLTGKDGGRK